MPSTNPFTSYPKFNMAMRRIKNEFERASDRVGMEYYPDLGPDVAIERFFRDEKRHKGWVGYQGTISETEMAITNTSTRIVVELKGTLQSGIAGDLGLRHVRATIQLRPGKQIFDSDDILILEDIAGRDALDQYRVKYDPRDRSPHPTVRRPLRGGAVSPR